MPLIINIETATTVCSVTLAKNGKAIACKEQDGDYTHAENLTVFIEAVVKQANIKFSDIDAIGISMGPGSYTGLRIGVSVAKGLCYALNKPLIAVNTLQHLALSISSNKNYSSNALFCPMIDARRMEVYCALFDNNNKIVVPTVAKIIDEHSFADILNEQQIYFFGNGALKCKNSLSFTSNALFIDNVALSSKSMILLTEKAFANGSFENLFTFEPYYLKDFLIKK